MQDLSQKLTPLMEAEMKVLLDFKVSAALHDSECEWC